MCRITLATMTDYPSYDKSLAFHTLMSLGAGDDWQKDGWGATDGINIIKSHSSYNDPIRTYRWKDALDPQQAWMGHVRAASAKTGLTRAESHPYAFKRFLGVHNGTMVPGSKTASIPDGPNTDSWRAFWLLDSLIRAYPLSMLSWEDWFENTHVLGHWLSYFMATSTFAFSLMLQDGSILIVKGAGERSLWYMKAGNGFLFHTRRENLRYLDSWSDAFGMSLDIDGTDILEVPSDTWCIVKPGQQEFLFHPLEYYLEPLPPPPTKKKKKVGNHAKAAL